MVGVGGWSGLQTFSMVLGNVLVWWWWFCFGAYATHNTRHQFPTQQCQWECDFMFFFFLLYYTVLGWRRDGYRDPMWPCPDSLTKWNERKNRNCEAKCGWRRDRRCCGKRETCNVGYNWTETETEGNAIAWFKQQTTCRCGVIHRKTQKHSIHEIERRWAVRATLDA